MITNVDILSYIVTISGQPVLALYNDIEQHWYYYSIGSFKPENPSNHIHECSLNGKEISGLIKSLTGFSHGFDNSDTITIMTKLNEIPQTQLNWVGFRWVKIT